MKVNKLFIFLTAVLAYTICSFSAYAVSVKSMARDGDPYLVDGVKWQNYHIDTGNAYISLAFPDQPKSMMKNNLLVGYSIYNDVTYEAKLYAATDFNYPVDTREGIQLFQSTTCLVTELYPNIPGVLYCLQVDIYNDALTKQIAICRVFATMNGLYVIRADNGPTDLTNYFFNSIFVK